jgi:F-type H+-transporting ATPase subunit b
MENLVINYLASAAAEPASGDILGSLGIDWQVLLLQIIAFAVLVLILAKFIYPQISAMLDRRDQVIDEAIKAAKDSESRAAAAEAETTKLLETAKKQADDIVGTARKESADLMTESEFEAKKKADSIIRSAQADLTKEVESARQALRQEALDLVATATEKVAAVKLDDDDSRLVEKTLKGGQ